MTTPRVTLRRHWVITVVFALIVLPMSLYGFGTKFLEFIAIFRGESDGAFAVTPIVNYLCASLGFFFLLCWATLRGMFTDVERPKVELLEREAALDGLVSVVARQREPARGEGGGPRQSA